MQPGKVVFCMILLGLSCTKRGTIEKVAGYVCLYN